MKSYFEINILKVRHWTNKDLDKVVVPLLSFKIPIPKLGGDAFSRDLRKVRKSTFNS